MSLTSPARAGPRCGAAPRARSAAPSPAAPARQGNRRPRAKIADHLTEPPHQRPHVRDVELPALLDDAEHAPGQLLAHRRGQPGQVNPRRPPPLVSQPAAELLRDGGCAEMRKAHAGRHRLPQTLEDLRPVTGRQAAAARCRIERCAAHGHSPSCPASGKAARQPAVNAFHSATARNLRVIGDVAIDVQRGLHVGMAKPAADHVHRHPGQQQGRGVAVPQPVRRPARRHLPGQPAAQPPDQVIDRLRPPRREPRLARKVHEHEGCVEVIDAMSAPASHSCHTYSP